MLKILFRLCAVGACAVAVGAQIAEIRQYPLDNLDGVITKSGVRFDKSVSSDRAGSLRINASSPVTGRARGTRRLSAALR